MRISVNLLGIRYALRAFPSFGAPAILAVAAIVALSFCHVVPLAAWIALWEIADEEKKICWGSV